jgi:hypothetical protein
MEGCVVAPYVQGKTPLLFTNVIRHFLVFFLILESTADAGDISGQLAQIMRGRSGTAVVIEVQSDHVLVTYHMDVAARRLARPGSAFKPFTLLALLQSRRGFFLASLLI